jgi:1-acyl-sn-glycerol-3-phosphate acyltransferase
MRGCTAITLFVLNTVFWAVPVHLLALSKLLIRFKAWQIACARAIMKTVTGWIWVALRILRLTQKTSYDIEGVTGLKKSEWYFLNCNHQSWADILVLLITFHGHIPFFKFFVKKELIKIPLFGTALWALDYPFMKRYSKEFLKKNPHLRGKDLEATKKACEHYRHTPVSVLNFIEGTRFTPEKHERQQSPYRHLLRPKSGGFAFALSAMNGLISRMLDVTIIYPPGMRGFWDYLCGRIPHIAVRVKKYDLPPDILKGDYQNDPEFRARFQSWVNDVWSRKDAVIEQYRSSHGSASSAA